MSHIHRGSLLVVVVLVSAWAMAYSAAEPGAGPYQTVKAADLPAGLRSQLLATKAADQGPVAPGLHTSEDGSAFLYGPPADGGSKSPGPGESQPWSTAYTATLARDLSGGIEVTAAGSAYPVKLVPLSLNEGPGRIVGERLEYSTRQNARVVYSFKGNGVKEDIILAGPSPDTLSLQFRLDMDPMLEARLDARGNLLIYGPDPILGGFIQTADDRSAELILKARQRAPKDRLLYLIPAPVFRDGAGMKQAGRASFAYSGNTLTLSASGLAGLAAPVTIDPSIVVTTTGDFMAGNDEGMISFDTNAISRTAQSGGTAGAWATTNAFTTARYSHTSVAYNGYVYVLGGRTASLYLNDVQYAPIYADGTLGAWAATTSFATARAYHTSAVYNGYVYVIGGYNGTHFNDVQFAPINADGTLGSWSTTSAFTTARRTHKTVVYNGFLYILGGFAGGSTYFNDVQFAPIHADGTVGSWTTTTSFITGRYGHTSVAYDGFLYVIGGYSGVYMSDSQFARIHSDGTVGAWTASASLALPHFTSTSLALDGYLYVIGGASASGTYLNDVQFAAIHSNGTLAAWNATSAFSSARFGHTSVVVSGRLYVLGGTGSTIDGDVQYSTVSTGTNPLVGTWTTTNSFGTARFGHTSVASDGFLYVLGGQTSSGYVNDVQYAPVYADGTIGTWTVTNPFTTVRGNHASVAYNGYIYVLGGQNSTTTFNDVQVAPINPDGTVGAWATTASFATVRHSHAVVAYNGYLYLTGGLSGSSFLSDVQMAPINAGGTLGAWAATTSFLSARDGHAAVAYNGYLYILGGYNNPNYLDSVQYAPISATNGTVGTWATATALTTRRGFLRSVVRNGFLYAVGGFNDILGDLADVLYAPINANGSIGSWTAGNVFTTARTLHTCVAHNGTLYVLGGWDGSSYHNDVQFAPLSDPGTLGAWTSTTALPTTRGGHASVAGNGYLYLLGGYNGSYFSDVQFAPVNDNGTLGAWAATTSFTTARGYHTSVLINGYLYVIGGYNGSYLSDVQFAPVHADGTVGTWTTTTGMTTARSYHASATCHGYLYVVGGYDGTQRYNDVQYAPIHANGTLGSWASTTAFTMARNEHASVAYDGYLYVIGGYGTSSSSLNDVQFAPIHADGSLGSWTATASFTYARYGHTSVARSGYMYVIGGLSGSGYNLNDVLSAPIHSDGTLGAWEGTTRFTTVRRLQATVAYNGNLYLTGGYSGNTPLSDVQVAALRTPEARGRYSKLLDIGSDQLVDSVVFSDSGHEEITGLTYATAPSSTAVLGARTTISDAAAGTLYSTGLGTCARWVWVSFDLDDTQSATTDAGGLNGRGDVLDFTVSTSTMSGIGDTLSGTKSSPNVHLAWTASPDATYYNIKRCAAGGGPCTPVTVASVSVTSYNDPVLSNGTSYWYEVEAANGTCTAP